MSINDISKAKQFLYEIQDKKDGESKSNVTKFMNGRKNVINLKILVCVDVSGSIGQEQFEQFMAQIDKIRGLSMVKVLETDDKVIALYDYFKTSQNEVMRLVGGGGTNFVEAFDKANQMKPDAVIFMTDGQVFGDSPKPPRFPVGWVLTHDGKQPYEFGEIIETLQPTKKDNTVNSFEERKEEDELLSDEEEIESKLEPDEEEEQEEE